MDITAVQASVSTTLGDVGPKLLGAIALWVVGRWLIGRVRAHGLFGTTLGGCVAKRRPDGRARP